MKKARVTIIMVIVGLLTLLFFSTRNHFAQNNESFAQDALEIAPQLQPSTDTRSSMPKKASIESESNTKEANTKPRSKSNDALKEQHNFSPENSQPLLQNYSGKMPRIFKLKNMFQPGTDYSLPVDYSEEHLAYFKGLSDRGDALAKFLYATRLALPLGERLEQEYLMKGDSLDVSLWHNHFAEVRRLFIESAVAGVSLGAIQLTETPLIIYKKDPVEALAWALIADQMESNDDRFLTKSCREFNEQCTAKSLAKALDRALFYLDFYNFKTKEKNENTVKN